MKRSSGLLKKKGLVGRKAVAYTHLLVTFMLLDKKIEQKERASDLCMEYAHLQGT